MAPGYRRQVFCAAVFLMAAFDVVHAPQHVTRGWAQSAAMTSKIMSEVRRGTVGLPEPVREMREAIVEAARSGRIEDLQYAIELNEIKPTLTDGPVRDVIGYLKSKSSDGTGRDILKALLDILESGWVALPLASDIENNRVYVWPYFAETGTANLTPAEEHDLARLVSPAEAEKMRASGRYAYWRIGIGADGVWHFLLE